MSAGSAAQLTFVAAPALWSRRRRSPIRAAGPGVEDSLCRTSRIAPPSGAMREPLESEILLCPYVLLRYVKQCVGKAKAKARIAGSIFENRTSRHRVAYCAELSEIAESGHSVVLTAGSVHDVPLTRSIHRR